MRAILVLLVVCIASASAQSLEDTLNKVVTDIIAKQITDQLPGLADQAIKSLVDKAPELMGQISDKGAELAKSLLGKVSDWFGKRDVEQVQEFLQKVQDAKKQLVAKLEEIYKNLIGKLVKSQNKREESDAVEEAKNGFQDFFKQIGKHIQDILGEISKQGVGKVLDTLNPNKDSPPKRDLSDMIKDLEAFVAEHFNKAGDVISEELQKVVVALKPLIKDAKEKIGKRGILEDLANNFFGKSPQEAFAEVQKALIEAVVGHKDNVLAALQPKYEELKAQLSGHAQNAADSLLANLKNALGSLSESVGKRGILEDLANNFFGKTPQEAFAEVQKAVIEAVVGHKDNVLAALKPKYDELKEQLSGHAQNAADSLLANLKNALGSFSDSIGKRGILEDLANNFFGKSPQEAFAEVQKALIEAIVGHKDNVLALLQPKYEELKAQLSGHAQNAADSLLANLKNALGSLSESVGK
jgi:predicted RNase H-like HicB family nuclease/vacuolar-type H+-ATPase subunit H